MFTGNGYMHVHHAAVGVGGGGLGHTPSAFGATSNVSHGNNGAALGVAMGADPVEALDDNPLSIMVRAQNRIDALEGQLDEQRRIIQSLTRQLDIVNNFFTIFKALNAPIYSSSQAPDVGSQLNPGSPWAPTNIKSDLGAMIGKLSREESFFPDEA